ncbi:cytochrome c oxidase assembly protein, partial [Mesorhizobium sp. M2A.F.Ca.ET.046.02.1.1]
LWRLSPLEDQQLAGLVMWVPAGLIYGGAALLLAGLWISNSGTREAAHALRPG